MNETMDALFGLFITFSIAILISCIIGLIILWLIIKTAVKSAMLEVLRANRVYADVTPESNDYLARRTAEYLHMKIKQDKINLN